MTPAMRLEFQAHPARRAGMIGRAAPPPDHVDNDVASDDGGVIHDEDDNDGDYRTVNDDDVSVDEDDTVLDLSGGWGV